MSNRRVYWLAAIVSAIGAVVYGYGWWAQGRVAMGWCALLFVGVALLYVDMARSQPRDR